MRYIKFRAWDKIEKKMCEVWSLKLDNVGCPSNASLYGNERCNCDLDTIDLLQYAGIKDKNGKEIFEGDIIKVEPYEGNERLYQIVYSRASFVLKWITPDDDIRISMQDEFEMEIIGNSYENPELLK